MATKDECFPRGGFKPKANGDTKGKSYSKQENLFGNSQVEKKGKAKKKRQNVQENHADGSVPDFLQKSQQSTAISADALSPKKIQEGMTLLASVFELNIVTINVEFPGRFSGVLRVQDISAAYSKVVSNAVKANMNDAMPTLDSLFKRGQFMPVKVLEMGVGEKERTYVSCNPAEINSQMKHFQFTNNMLVWGAVKEKSDHGYLIDLGVRNCRAHLPFVAVEDGVEYHIGQVLYMVVTKCVNSKEATTLNVSALQKDFDETVESAGTSVDRVIPGMQVKFLTQRLLKNGLEGRFFDECTGFINEMYLKKPFDTSKKYQEMDTLTARLLYVNPVSKHGYFTLRSLSEPIPDKFLKKGLRLAATVMAKSGSGLSVKLEGGAKGYITYKRLMQTTNANAKENEDLATLIANKYPAGMTKHCTILEYNHMERVYICTFENITDLMNIDDLELAQVIQGTIYEVKSSGLCIRVGKLIGFAPNSLISNAQNYDNIKNKFKVGQKVTAKVWDLADNTILLTMKPDLLSSNLHLTSYENINHTEQYPGVVVNTYEKGVLLSFYGGIRGFLPVRNIPQLGDKDARNEFYFGQVIKSRIANYVPGRMTLTMNLPIRKRIPVGKMVSRPKVCQVDEDGLHVLVDGVDAFVPKQQLGVEGLGTLLAKTYKVNDILDEELMCLVDSMEPILSVRECVAYKRDALRVVRIDEFQVGLVVRAIVKDENSLIIPVKGHKKEFAIGDNKLPTIDMYESLLTRVEKCHGKRRYNLSTKLKQVFSFKYMETLQYLDQYLQDIERLRNRYMHTRNPLADMEIGATVDCVVNQVDPHRGCSLFILPMHCQGLATLHDCTDAVIPGAQVKGKILWINYELKYAAVTLKPFVMDKINDVQTNEIDLSNLHRKNDIVHVKILHANRNIAVGVLPEKYNRQLVYLPVKLHENDFNAKINYYDTIINNKVQAKIVKMKSGRICAVTLDMLKEMDGKMKGCDKIVKRERREREKVGRTKSEIFESPKEEDEGIESSEDVKSEYEDIEVKMETDVQENVSERSKKNKRKAAEEIENGVETTSKKKKKEKPTNKPEVKTPVLPGMSSFFFDTDIEIKRESDDEDEPSTSTKKKPTPAERAQKVREEEERLRKIETELADASILPQSAEQFDRALLGNPDDSELWTRYIAFHAQSTEFEKARSVARRALDRISYTALQDRLNVWLAYLNLENMYGTKDSFDKIFEESARCNDALAIYLETIKMLSDMGKTTEMEEKIKKARGKFKQETQMWLEIGKVYYKSGRFAEARKLKDTALVTLADKKAHMQLIVQFAIMEFNFGEASQGETLFETIMQADPKRVDIWCTYVDQLIKKEKIDLARNVLTRAVGQKLPYKKMRTLFKKYHAFEKTYGDEETLAHVTKLLKEYGDQ